MRDDTNPPTLWASSHLPFFTDGVFLAMSVGRGTEPSCSTPRSGHTCFFRRLRRFSWWAARAKATVPRAVANRTFLRPGVSRSWEKADCREGGGVLGRPGAGTVSALKARSQLGPRTARSPNTEPTGRSRHGHRTRVNQ